jgi:DNA (cytosine-5)-methyltransferase 1
MKSISVFDLFAGPGGLGEGFASYQNEQMQTPFSINLSIEKDPNAHRTLTTRALFRKLYKDPIKRDVYNQYVRGDISREQLFCLFPKEAREALQETMFEPKELGKDNNEIYERIRILAKQIDGPKVLIGGPPCQAYSLAGRSRNAGNEKYVASEDKRHFLYKEYLSVLAVLKPDVFVMENVRGILSSKVEGKLVFPEILKDLENPKRVIKDYTGEKYRIHSLTIPSDNLNRKLKPEDFLIKAENYGIPQARHRVILLGVKVNSSVHTDVLTRHSDMVSVGQVLRDLPKLRSGFSKSKDTDSSWRTTIKKVLKKTSRLIKEELPQIGEVVIKTEPHKGLKRSSTVANYHTVFMPEFLENWLIDRSLNFIANHETRGHIESDLLRYSFSSTYAKFSNGYSPKAKDFPKSLAPAHKNWESGSHADRFRVQSYNKCATTITSHISKDGHYFIHYDPQQCRSLTVREAARLQTFPDNYFFEGNRTSQYVQVGNAVPPFLALQIAKIVERFIKNSFE